MWNIWIRSSALHLVRASSFKLQMYFFKNGTGWCVRHDSRTKLQAPSLTLQYLESTKLREQQAASVKPQAASFKRQAASCKLPDS
jgi:hypothetical protein